MGRWSTCSSSPDLNGDALDDIVVGDQIDHDPDFTPADRLTKAPLHIFVSNGDGTFTHAPEVVDGPVEAHTAVVVAGDLNGDGKNDLVVVRPWRLRRLGELGVRESATALPEL